MISTLGGGATERVHVVVPVGGDRRGPGERAGRDRIFEVERVGALVLDDLPHDLDQVTLGECVCDTRGQGQRDVTERPTVQGQHLRSDVEGHEEGRIGPDGPGVGLVARVPGDRPVGKLGGDRFLGVRRHDAGNEALEIADHLLEGILVGDRRVAGRTREQRVAPELIEVREFPEVGRDQR